MSDLRKINSALVSVFHKEGLGPVIELLNNLGVTLYATGGTRDFIQGMNVPVVAVEDITDYPSILDGRVKTLHQRFSVAYLEEGENGNDVMQLENYNIPPIDLVIVDLYPFSETLASNADHTDIIEKIDIGGISLIRAAAKNYNDVVIVSSMTGYKGLIEELNQHSGSSTLSYRKKQAAEAFAVSSHYDTAIYQWFSEGSSDYLKCSIMQGESLRYGENPHQKGRFFGDLMRYLTGFPARRFLITISSISMPHYHWYTISQSR
jgi:phosphoribosylaminoimidazolecarboxamide formyltransferase / IMP cyclohydrolase